MPEEKSLFTFRGSTEQEEQCQDVLSLSLEEMKVN